MSAMRNGLAAAAAISSLLMSACSSSTVCVEDCVQLNGVQNVSREQISAQLKKACEGLARHGTPQIQEQTTDSVTAYCPA